MGFDAKIKTTVGDIHVFKKSVAMAQAGDNIGVLLRGVKIYNIQRGMMLTEFGSTILSNHFEAKIYFLSRKEGGRSRPITSKYCQQLFCQTWSIACRIDLIPPEEMIMPGEYASVKMFLLKKMVMNMGQPFTVRENNVTVATGIVTKVIGTIPMTTTLGKIKMDAAVASKKVK